jgi:hypothetical protein
VEAAGVAWWSSAPTPSWEDARSIPNPGTPFPTLGNGCFTLLPGSGWQVLFDSQHGSIGPKNQTPCKNWWWDSQNPIHKKKKITVAACDNFKPELYPTIQSLDAVNILPARNYGKVTEGIELQHDHSHAFNFIHT